MKSKSRIRVLQVIARMNVGGPAVLVADLTRNLDSSRFEMKLITGYCDDNESDYLDSVATNIQAIRIPGLGRSVSILRDMKAFFLLVQEIRRFKPDVIHTHTAKAGVLGRIAGLIAFPRAKRIHTFHGHLLHGYFSPLKTNFVVLIERILAPISVALIAIGNQVKNDLLAAGVGKPNQYSVIFPGLEELNIQSKASARSQLSLEADTTYIVFVGRLTQIKRPDRLIEIARHLKANHQKVELLIAGAGEKFAKIHESAEQDSLPIVFLGWRNDIGRILSASDIVILCSDNEGIPLTLIQASQAGLPIVSTNVGSVSDIVLDGESGLLTGTNAQSLVKALDELLYNPSKMDRFGQAGKLRAKHLFSLKGMVDAHEKLYSQIIKEIS